MQAGQLPPFELMRGKPDSMLTVRLRPNYLKVRDSHLANAVYIASVHMCVHDRFAGIYALMCTFYVHNTKGLSWGLPCLVAAQAAA